MKNSKTKMTKSQTEEKEVPEVTKEDTKDKKKTPKKDKKDLPLKDVVAFVDIKIEGNIQTSETFVKKLEELGAKVNKSLTKTITHGIFFNYLSLSCF